jgi:hypothetical protein
LLNNNVQEIPSKKKCRLREIIISKLPRHKQKSIQNALGNDNRSHSSYVDSGYIRS